HMIPLDLLPSPWGELLKALPFKYLAYFPAAVFLNKVPAADLARELLTELAWAVFFLVLARVLFRVGLRRYSAYGRRSMRGAARYFRLLFALARFGLLREMAYRGNFLAKVTVEVLWLGILLVFYTTIFGQTDNVRGWTRAEYLFFVGTFFTLGGIIETFFLSN